MYFNKNGVAELRHESQELNFSLLLLSVPGAPLCEIEIIPLISNAIKT